MYGLASRFGSRSPILRSSTPLTDEQIRNVAPSIFADEKHASRSDRYTYIPTATVLTALRAEGFQPFMVCQTRVRDAGKRDHTKHMIRLRHATTIAQAEANEIVLLNSHDGSSSYQMLAGMFRFVCQNGLVAGMTTSDVRVRHNGNIVDQVIEGAFEVLGSFAEVEASRDTMKQTLLTSGEAELFATAALSLKYDDETPAPITPAQLLTPRRSDDRRDDLWSVFNRTQENVIQGGLRVRTPEGRRQRTRPVQGIDQSVKLNRALWMLADGMQRLKG